MSEYPIGFDEEMIHCLAEDEYSEHCRRKLEKELIQEDLKQELEQ